MKNVLRWSWVAAALVMACAAQAEDAATWPSHLIRATIPFGAGSATDVVPRLFFDRLSAELGQPIVVENRVGAGGTLGTGAVAKAEPDGYTVLAHSAALTIAPAIFPNLTYDIPRDLSSVLMIGSNSNVMIVPMSRPWRTVQDFVAAAKAKDSQINFGSVGIGSAVHISAEKFRLAAGFEATHVPYRGGPEVITDILGGRIDFYMCPISTALPLVKEGQVRALVVSGDKRAAELPDVPSLVEAGYKAGVSTSWFGVFMPSKTPRPIIDKMHAAGVKLLATPEMQASLKRLGVEPFPIGPAEMDRLLVKEIADNKVLLKDVK